MTASLMEMVLAIVIAGLIFASAIIPTTQTMVAYQEAEVDLRAGTLQATAAVRIEQVAACIWRDADPPANLDTLSKAQVSGVQVGDWELRQTGDYLEQNWASTSWSIIVQPVQTFALQYLMDDGSWTSSAAGPALEEVLAVRFDWSNPDNGRAYGGLTVAPDRAFSAGRIGLPQPDTSDPYDRADYEQSVTISLGSWQ
jgi:hypothetical protein